MGNGESAFGGQGAIHRSMDAGRTWEPLPLPTVPNGTVWNLAAHPADANFLLASTVNGQVFASADGGTAWRKLPRDFGEVHALAGYRISAQADHRPLLHTHGGDIAATNVAMNLSVPLVWGAMSASMRIELSTAPA